MVDVTLNRSDIARIVGNDPRAIRAFEQLVASTNASQEVPTDILIDTGNASAAVGSALASIQQLQAGDPSPAVPSDPKPNLDYIDFSQSPPHINATGRMNWNNTDETIEVGLKYGVVQQVGLESYIRVRNNTGVTIPNGSIVAYGGVDGQEVEAVPFLADGSMSSLSILGVMTHELPDSGTTGYATTDGKIRTLDTSAWAPGTPLYASPINAGEFTSTKPTAPDVVAPIAIVLVQDATEGIINVRLLPQLEEYYGIFSRTTNATASAIDTAQAITWENDLISDGVTFSGSQIIVPDSGLYRFAPRLQFQPSSAADRNAWLWFRHNGADVANSAIIGTSTTNNSYFAMSHAIFLTLAAGDYVEVMWSISASGLVLTNVAATAFAPASPAATVQVNQMQQ